MTELSICDACEHLLSPWESNPCACVMSRPKSNSDIAYVIATSAAAPLHLRDFVRLADVDYGRSLSQATANATIAPQALFCWAGKGLYGLFRHGPLPGPRNLGEAARLLLTASERPLTIEGMEFCLKQLGYRFNPASLYNAVVRTHPIEWGWQDGHFRVPTGPEHDKQLLADVPVVHPARSAQWRPLKDYIAFRVQTALEDRNERLRKVDARRMTSYDWE